MLRLSSTMPADQREPVPAQPRVVAPGVPATPGSGVSVNPSGLLCFLCDLAPDLLKPICRQQFC
jgi:hypothetical protein